MQSVLATKLQQDSHTYYNWTGWNICMEILDGNLGWKSWVEILDGILGLQHNPDIHCYNQNQCVG